MKSNKTRINCLKKNLRKNEHFFWKLYKKKCISRQEIIQKKGKIIIIIIIQTIINYNMVIYQMKTTK